MNSFIGLVFFHDNNNNNNNNIRFKAR